MGLIMAKTNVIKEKFNKIRNLKDEEKAGLVFVLPPIIGFLLFTAVPFIFSIYASFTSWDSMTDLTSLFTMDAHEREFFYIGFENYKELFSDGDFWKALWNTFFYMIGIPIGMLWAISLAVSFNKKLPAVKAFRVIYYIPVVSSIVAVSLLWKWLYNGDFGLINQFLNWAFGIKGPNWLENPSTVKPSIMAMTIWRGVGGTALLYLGGLQNLPKSYYEAAVLDGASGFRMFRSITWPLLRPISFFIVVTGIIGGAQMIVEPQIMAPSGGTDYSAGTIVFYIWQRAFGPADAKGFACATAWVLAIIIFIVTALQFKFSSSNDNYLE